MNPTEARVLIIDDDPGRQTLLPQGRVGFSVLHPLDVEDASLDGVDLVCVDEYLGEEWAAEIQQRVGSLPALHNGDGLAVAAALRSRARLAARSGEPGLAVALFTAELDKLSDGLPQDRQEPLTASLHDLEWVFRFERGPANFGDRVEELALAARSITQVDVASSGGTWLGLGEEPWADLARAQIDDCRPPQSVLAHTTFGRSFLRWLAQRILPYPTFLVDDTYAANLLGVGASAFHGAELQRLLVSGGALYRGPLHEKFLGRRWWRAALQHVLDEHGASPWDDPRDKAAALAAAVGTAIPATEALNPVVCYGPRGEVTSVDADASVCVRIQLDGWPLYADEAWALLDDARTVPALRALVAHDDQPRLES